MKLKFLSKLLLGASVVALSSGCVAQKDSILAEQEKCSKMKPVLSLEQSLRKISADEGFTARIENHTQFNPTIYGNSFADIRNELYNSNLDFEIHNYADVMDTKRISIFAKGERYSIDKELLKIEVVVGGQKYHSVADIVKYFNNHKYKVNIPDHLLNKPVALIPNGTYKLSDLINEVSNKLLEMNISNTITTQYNPNTKTKEIDVSLKELRFKYPKENLITLQNELKQYSISSRIDNAEIAILSNYKSQMVARDLIERRTKNLGNVYVACLKKGENSFDSIALNDGVEAPLDTYESLKITKTNVDENGIEDYTIAHKTKDGIKEYKIKTNERRLKIAKEKINAKIYLY